MAEFNPPVRKPRKSMSYLLREESFSATPVKFRVEEYNHGHDIYAKFSLTNALLVPKDWKILDNVTTNCQTTPTSWQLKIVFNKVESMVSGDLKLRRTDSFKDQPVVVSMRMHVDHRFGYSTLINPSDNTVMSNQLLHMEIPHIVPSEYKNLLMDGTLEFDLRFFIKDCHPDLVPPPKPAPVRIVKKKSPEKPKPLPLEQRWHHTQR